MNFLMFLRCPSTSTTNINFYFKCCNRLFGRRFSTFVQRIATRHCPDYQMRRYRGRYMDQENADDHYHILPMGESDIRHGQGATITFISADMQTDNLLSVGAVSEVGFRLSDKSFLYGPVAIFPKTALSWRVLSPEHITPRSLELFFRLQPKLDILIVGAGDKMDIDMVRRNVAPVIAQNRIGYEILDTEDAAALFNFLNNEHRYVAAALFPPRKIMVTAEEFATALEEFQYADTVSMENRTLGLFSLLDFLEEGDDADIRSACYRIWGIRSEKAQEMNKWIHDMREMKEKMRLERIEEQIEKRRIEDFLEAEEHRKSLEKDEESEMARVESHKENKRNEEEK